VPAAALAQSPGAERADLLGSGLASPSGWWGAPGRAGWLPDGDLGVGYPWTLAGLVAGTWALDELGRPRAPMPAPGVAGAQEALTWFDSLSVAAGEGGGWDGFDATLARASAGPGLLGGPGAGGMPRADLVLTNGSRALGDHALTLWRGDSLGGFRAETASGERGPAGGLAGAGRDLYDVAGAVARGRHLVEGAFAHRRSNANLMGGETQEVRGEGGHGRYRFEGQRWRMEASLARGYDRRESSGGGWTPEVRLADENAAALELEHGDEHRRLGVRWSWDDARVTPARGDGGRERSHAQWGAVRWQGPFGDGRLEAALGLGRHGGIGRTEVAPSIAWRFTGKPWEGRVVLERLLTPVWADLAAGQAPFLQDSWVTGLEVGGHALSGGRARVSFLAGRTRDRALIARLPLESLALRSGFRADPHVYDFGLLVGEASWRTRHWASGLEGFALARDASPLQPWVDPGRGGRVFVEARASLFQGDLHVRPRIDAWAVGPRESEAAPSRALPGYVTFAAGLQLTLADAVLLIEGRNLEDRARPQTWVDLSTGSEALGPGRELRTTFTWRLWN
jgi:hypothetical protein